MKLMHSRLVVSLTTPIPRSVWKACLFRMLALVLGLVCATFIAEGVAAIYFAGDRQGLETIRKRLASEIPPSEQTEGAFGQPYLLYVQTPGYHAGALSDIDRWSDVARKRNYHNPQGYRGEAVPMQRTPNVVRVLCLGGSTTYGAGTADSSTSYPAHLKRILEARLSEDVKGVEVINGGLSFATSAELLTHYHFKFHYFRPDVVIINTGGNDALANSTLYYQPDYSHWRQPIQTPQPLAPFGRTLVKSRLAAWFITLVLHGREPGHANLQRPPDLPPPTIWHPAAKKRGLVSQLPDSELAFTHNLNSLVDEILKDEAEVIVVPFRVRPRDEEWSPSGYFREEELQRTERILRQLASKRDLTLVPFPGTVISKKNWVDECHLNSEGCRQKAEYFAQYVGQLLSNAMKKREATLGSL